MKNISHYFQSGFDGSWWIVFKNDRPNLLIEKPPQKSKFPIIPFRAPLSSEAQSRYLRK